MVVITNRRRSMTTKRVAADRIAGGHVVDEQPRQIEQPGEPGDQEHDVEGLKPQQVHTRSRARPRARSI